MSEALEMAIEAFHNVYDGAEFASVDRAIKAAIDEYIRQHDDWRAQRALFAAMAMQGMCGDPERNGPMEAYARDAVGFADALLAELAKEQSDV